MAGCSRKVSNSPGPCPARLRAAKEFRSSISVFVKAIDRNSPWGGYHGTSAFGVMGLFRVSDNFVIDGGVGVGVSHGDVGGRFGLTYAW
jgi:hypothetical protein